MRRPSILLLALALAFAVHSALMRPEGDYVAYHTAGQRVWAGEPVYQPQDLYPFKYSPPVALAFATLAKLPLRAAKGVVVFLSVLALLWVARWARRAAGASSHSHLVLLLVAPHTLQLFSNGQVDALLLWLAVASEADAEEHPVRSGVLLAAAALVKAPYLVLVLPALYFRQGRRLWGLGAGLAAAGAVTWVGFQSLAPFEQWRALLSTTTTELLYSPSNEGLMALAIAFVAPPGTWAFNVAVGGVGLALIAAFVAVVVRAESRQAARFCATCAALYLCAFLSPLGWWSNLIGLIPLLYALTTRLSAGNRARLAAGAALSIGALTAAYNHHLLGFQAMEWVLPWHHYGVAGLVMAITWAGILLWEQTIKARARATDTNWLPSGTVASAPPAAAVPAGSPGFGGGTPG